MNPGENEKNPILIISDSDTDSDDEFILTPTQRERLCRKTPAVQKKVHLVTILQCMIRAMKTEPPPPNPILRTAADRSSPWGLHFKTMGALIKCNPSPTMSRIMTLLQQCQPWVNKGGKKCKAICFHGNFRVANTEKNIARAGVLVAALDACHQQYGGCTITDDTACAPEGTVLTPDGSKEGQTIATLTKKYTGSQLLVIPHDKYDRVMNFNNSGTSQEAIGVALQAVASSELPYAHAIVPFVIATDSNATKEVKVDARFKTGIPFAGVVGIARHASCIYSVDGHNYILADSWKQKPGKGKGRVQFKKLKTWFEDKECTLTQAKVKVTQGNEKSCAPAALTKALNAAKTIHCGGNVHAMATGLLSDETEVPNWIELSRNSAVCAQRMIWLAQKSLK